MKIELLEKPRFFWVFVLTLLPFSSSAFSTNDQKITIQRKNISLEEIFKTIKTQVGLTVFYSNEILDDQDKIDVSFKDAPLSSVLNTILNQRNLTWAIHDQYILIQKKTKSAEAAPQTPARSKSNISNGLGKADLNITGMVTDDKGVPIPGVSVKLKGTTIAVLTSTAGKFSISVPSGGTLVFSSIGYISHEVTVSSQTPLTIRLAEDNKALDEVVVVGYGTAKRKDLTGSVGSIDSKEIKDLAVTRVEQALSGRVAGVQVKLADGQPGSSPQIRVRGIGSISAGGDPLYVVDGFPTDNIQTLNPNDIESLDVLKDASATAIYGSRGSNGVVIINTKRGLSGKARISFDTYYGTQSITRRPEFLTASQQANYYYNSIRNRNLDLGNNITGDPATWGVRVPQTVLDVMSGKNTYNTDALDAVLRTAPQQSYNIAVAGGSEKIKYALSGEYFDQDGIIINSNFKRYSLRANIDAQLTDRLSVKVNLNPSYTKNNNVIASGAGAGVSTSIIGSATSAQPYYPLTNPDGSYFIYRSIDASTDLYNPLALAREKKDDLTTDRFLGNVIAEYKILDGLKFNVLLGATTINLKGASFTPNLPVFFNTPATGTDYASSEHNWLAEYTANYNKTFGKHNFAVLAGYTVQEDVIELNSLTSNNFPNNLVPSLSAVSGIISTGTSSRSEWSILSELARLNYNYDGKYLVTASIRRDGSSRFGANNKYGVFPSAAVAWRVSDEKFMKDIPLISQLKLRASYGKTGNNNIGNYASMATLNYLKYALGGVATGGTAPSAIANPDLTWETQEQINTGIDLALFKNRVNITVDHFISKNKDLLLNVNVPTSTGFATALKNIGEVKNTGWEVVLSTVNLNGKLQWSTDLNFSAYKNKVVRLGPTGDDIISLNNITRIGQPIGMFYGFIVDGIFKNSAELAAGPVYNKGLSDATRVGDIKFRDVSGPNGVPDGKIDNNDMTIMGSPYPDFYMGMTNRFSYQNFSLSFNFAGSFGSEIYSNSMVIYRLNRSRSRTLSTEANFWKSEADPGDGQTPRPVDQPTGGLRLASTRYMDKGTYVRLNNVTLGYIFPEKVSKAMRLSSLRIYGSATNPLVITHNRSFNPDVSNTGNSLNPGIDNNNYPLPKSYVLGLNVTF
ncbi:TonB-dependent receptor [Pedobacter hartonius]|uniref:TonB-linked outer membrane protein, SusC/RagA family n=1 Tax=Pedobacter hartonius TaxID=425514 RepID=A0A1H4DWX3_9SPHI|nr:TonB-dependent receptor [Pedobacter hartonius]SEA77295.1 TonB-linked outer membrane protein, SusC/RagA family [Pedobacter hartonius]